MADACPDIMGLVIIADGVPVADPPAADVVDAGGVVLVAVLVAPPQAARVKVRAAASAAAPERANVFIWVWLLELW
jgi:hypothetical protein